MATNINRLALVPIDDVIIIPNGLNQMFLVGFALGNTLTMTTQDDKYLIGDGTTPNAPAKIKVRSLIDEWNDRYHGANSEDKRFIVVAIIREVGADNFLRRQDGGTIINEPLCLIKTLIQTQFSHKKHKATRESPTHVVKQPPINKEKPAQPPMPRRNTVNRDPSCLPTKTFLSPNSVHKKASPSVVRNDRPIVSPVSQSNFATLSPASKLREDNARTIPHPDHDELTLNVAAPTHVMARGSSPQEMNISCPRLLSDPNQDHCPERDNTAATQYNNLYRCPIGASQDNNAPTWNENDREFDENIIFQEDAVGPICDASCPLFGACACLHQIYHHFAAG